jgi:hypothetical protein
MTDDLSKWLYPHKGARDEAWDRLSALAGLTPEGHVAPPKSQPFKAAAITQMELMGYVMAPDGTVLKEPHER